MASLIVLAGVCAAGAARAQDAVAEARAHFDRGAALAGEHKYEEAALAFKASYQGDPRKEALFAWAQVERLAGNCSAALALYRQFLAQPDLTRAQREAAELNLGRCEPAPQDAIKPATEPAAPRMQPTRATAIARPAAPPPAMVVAPAARSRRAVLLGAGLLAGAAAALAGSATFFVLARNDERDASSAPVWDDYYKAQSRAHDRQRLAAGALGAGVLLGGGALLQWMLTAPAQPRLTAWAGADVVGLRGRF